MRILVLTLVAFLSFKPVLAQDTNGEDDHAFRIKKNNGDAPQKVELGLHGKLKFEKDKDGFDYLTFVTPSGASYSLVTRDQDISDELQRLVKKKDNEIEVSGLITERGGVKTLNVRSIDRKTMDNEGQYAIYYGLETDLTEKRALVKFFSELPNTKVIGGDGAKYFTIKSDFSQKQMEKLLKAESLHYDVQSIEPVVIYRAN